MFLFISYTGQREMAHTELHALLVYTYMGYGDAKEYR